MHLDYGIFYLFKLAILSVANFSTPFSSFPLFWNISNPLLKINLPFNKKFLVTTLSKLNFFNDTFLSLRLEE